MERPAGVAALPLGAAAALRAQAVISSPAEAVAELVANSLDAGAREVHVELDLAPGGLALAVRDDGEGIRAADLPLLGRRNATSKGPGSTAAAGTEVSKVLGYRGEALACLCEAASEVEVTSRAVGSFETHACLLRGGGMPQHGLALEQRKRQGTTVVVSGLFAAQPVRRKALAAAGWVLGQVGAVCPGCGCWPQNLPTCQARCSAKQACWQPLKVSCWRHAAATLLIRLQATILFLRSELIMHPVGGPRPRRRLQREADRCKEAVLRLALLRADVTFTVFDRGRKTFLLRMLRVSIHSPVGC